MSKHELTHEHFAEHPDEQVDPHGFAKGHAHGHVILSTFTLRTVLTALLVFTALTVFCAQGEKLIEAWTGFVFPHWVNVAVAMSIATVKGLIVAGYFMQLKYDNPLNSVIMLFCFFALSLFLGFTALDLGGRGEIYAFKSGEVQAGGLGGVNRTETQKNPDGTTMLNTDGTKVKQNVAISGPLYLFPAQHLKEKLRNQLAARIKDPAELDKAVEARFEEIRREVMAHGHAAHAPHAEPVGSNANQSRRRSGPTPGLFDAKPAHTADHGHGGSH